MADTKPTCQSIIFMNVSPYIIVVYKCCFKWSFDDTADVLDDTDKLCNELHMIFNCVQRDDTEKTGCCKGVFVIFVIFGIVTKA